MALNYPGNVTLSKRCIEPVGPDSSRNRAVGADLVVPSTQEPIMETIDSDAVRRAPWNKGKLVDQKAPLKLKKSGLFGSDYNLRLNTVS
jgi:hypothetical protein